MRNENTTVGHERGPILAEYMRTHKVRMLNGAYYLKDAQSDEALLGLVGEERAIEAYLQKRTDPDA